MASKTNRARRLERARAERRMARLAAVQRRRRRIQAGIGGALALVLVVLGTVWLLGGFDDKPEPTTLPTCTWTAREPVDTPDLTGLPPTTVPTTGVKTIIINTNLGEIRGIIDVGSAFCAAASVDFLAKQNFYNDTTCHQLDTILRTVTCGSRIPSYQFPNEGLPRSPLGTASPAPDPSATPGVDTASYYAKGAIVLDNLDVNATGSALKFVYGDNSALPPAHTQIGTISSGLEILEQIAAAGAVDDSGAATPAGKPAQDLTILSVTLTDGLAPAPTSGEPTADPTSPAPTTSAS